MNWGIKIIVGLGTFMLFIVGMGVYMVQKDTDSLEEINYYEKSLAYDQVYERKQNMLLDRAQPSIVLVGDTLRITFDKARNRGKLTFKRPADRQLDLAIPFSTQDSYYQLPLTTFVKGNWHLEIAWESGDRSYIFDQLLYF
ncbi:FixH family protein [Sphingobacterium oryzagri]|uniref:FixH family protein n=1 Tax=Sphingobacterium oryzagri TaxID=3025669 RepID=A0ABY7WGV3_9SPHI|nr:FixH family protein [Sphingobacterium sp. KACC 22765]WDF67751.1 FixH family protein [Sphingobacterium sp. KACC 22765]